jgi:hypothetical protein
MQVGREPGVGPQADPADLHHGILPTMPSRHQQGLAMALVHQIQRGLEDLFEEALDGGVGEGPPVVLQDPIQHRCFPGRVEACQTQLGLALADLKGQFGASVQQVQDLQVQRVDLRSKLVQAFVAQEVPSSFSTPEW